MTQLADDCFAFGGKLMTAAEALALLHRRIQPLDETEQVPLREALGRVLSADLVSAITVPPKDNAAVDGYAFAVADLNAGGDTALPVAGRAAAGRDLEGHYRVGTAVRVFTGAQLPEGCDTVVMQEDVRLEGNVVVIPAGLKRGANRRKAGEDLQSGQVALRRGSRLRAQEIGLAAAMGRPTLPVHRRLRVALFSTGDELRDPGEPLAPRIIHDANRHMLAALLQGLGVTIDDLGILPDREMAVREALAAAAGCHDLLLTSGGVSTGEEDHVRAAVETLGHLHFWRLAVKPGRPIALGQVGRVPFIGLPGNPVAAMVCFMRFCRPIILRLCGAESTEPQLFPVRADFEHQKKLDRREWLRAKLVTGPDGGLWAKPYPKQGSGIISSLVGSDGLVELTEEVTQVRRGSIVGFLPFREMSW